MSHLKTYFDVDTGYVLRKLLILLFPFSHRNWTLSYQQTEPVAPRSDVNAPDLYIPGKRTIVCCVITVLYMCALPSL